MRRVAAAVGATVALLVVAAPAPATAAGRGELQLPTLAEPLAALPGVGLAPDRLLTSHAPGPTADSERVTVAIGPDGTPSEVTVDQRLEITGVGDYQVRERGPARRVEPIGAAIPPVLKLGTVVWQGFSPGRRRLAGRLTLDPGLEAARLPLTVGITARDAAGRPTPVRAGGGLPPGGRVTVTLVNASQAGASVPTGTATARALAPPLDALLRAARRPPAGRPPTAGHGLPTAIAGTRVGRATVPVVAPLRVSGTIRVPGTTARVAGPGSTPIADGVRLRGVLGGTASFTVAVPATGGRLAIDLGVLPWLDARPLTPPGGHRTWRSWATSRPTARQRTAATATLMTVAAAAARSASYTPYLAPDLRGTAVSAFRYVVATAPAAVAAPTPLHPRPVAIGLTALALLAVGTNLVLLWRVA